MTPRRGRSGVTLNARKLRDILDDRGIRITEFARQAGVPRPTLSNAITGSGRPVSRVVASRIASALSLPREEILKEDDEDELRPTG
jgi:transcriptional regulator with XRE-family HTH domain